MSQDLTIHLGIYYTECAIENINKQIDMETIISIVLFVGVLYVVWFTREKIVDETMLSVSDCDPNKGSRKRKTQIVKSYVRTLSA